MGRRRRASGTGRENLFGGGWTTEKLDTIQKYLSSYTLALKNQTFMKGYIDAFAGTGYRDLRSRSEQESDTQPLLFPDLADEAPQALLDGSARMALKTVPPFDRYIFIEQRSDRCAELERLKVEFPDRAKDILIRRGDANHEIRELCGKEWRSRRAVLFLDPYGMQVEWATIESIAKTRAIDLWILFPLGIGVNRLLTRSVDIPEAWRQRLNLLLGTDDEVMAQGSGIEWTEATWNPVTGCTKISPGCTHCYAERMAERLHAMGQQNYRNGFTLSLQPHMLELPLQWRRPQTVFVNSMSDLFHKDVPACGDEPPGSSSLSWAIPPAPHWIEDSPEHAGDGPGQVDPRSVPELALSFGNNEP